MGNEARPVAASSPAVALACRPRSSQPACLPGRQLRGLPPRPQDSGGAHAPRAAAGLGCMPPCPAPASAPEPQHLRHPSRIPAAEPSSALLLPEPRARGCLLAQLL